MEIQKILQSIIMFVLFLLSSGNVIGNKAYKGPTTTAGLNLIKEHECFYPNFYTDPAGKKVVGYGYDCSTNVCDKIRPPITVAYATNLLKTQIKSFENCVSQNVKYADLNAAQFSALVSLTFNLGCSTLSRSVLLTKLNRNDVTGAAPEFAKWNKTGGKVIAALTKRRAAERSLFCSNKIC